MAADGLPEIRVRPALWKRVLVWGLKTALISAGLSLAWRERSRIVPAAAALGRAAGREAKVHIVPLLPDDIRSRLEPRQAAAGPSSARLAPPAPRAAHAANKGPMDSPIDRIGKARLASSQRPRDRGAVDLDRRRDPLRKGGIAPAEEMRPHLDGPVLLGPPPEEDPYWTAAKKIITLCLFLMGFFGLWAWFRSSNSRNLT